MDRASYPLPRLWVKGTANRVSQIKGKRFNGQARRQLWLTLRIRMQDVHRGRGHSS